MVNNPKFIGSLNRRDVLKYGLCGGLAAGIFPPLFLTGCGKKRQGKRPNIIVLTVDTLRADHTSMYGYHRDTTPVINAFAKSAMVFDNAVVSRGSTRPSYASMLTGLYPYRHGIYNSQGVLSDKLVTLPRLLKKAGYHTAAFVGNFVLVGELSGCDRGFDVYDDRIEQQELNRPNYERTAAATLKATLEWLETKPSEPFFLFTNFVDPHGPYMPPEKFRELYKSGKKLTLNEKQIFKYQRVGGSLNYYDYVDRYDGEIRYVDAALGELIEELKKRGLWDEALIIFTADHGESMGEHKIFFEHQYDIWEETVRVPLAIRLPRDPGGTDIVTPGRIQSVCSPMDMMPTILSYLNVEFDKKIDGHNLLDAIYGREDTSRTMFLEFPQSSVPSQSTPEIYGIRSSTHKLVRYFHSETNQIIGQAVFDISADPLEQKQIPYNETIPMHRRLGDELDAMLKKRSSYELPFSLIYYDVPLAGRKEYVEKRKRGQKTIRQLTPEQIKKLRSLGYID